MTQFSFLPDASFAAPLGLARGDRRRVAGSSGRRVVDERCLRRAAVSRSCHARANRTPIARGLEKLARARRGWRVNGVRVAGVCRHRTVRGGTARCAPGERGARRATTVSRERRRCARSEGGAGAHRRVLGGRRRCSRARVGASQRTAVPRGIYGCWPDDGGGDKKRSRMSDQWCVLPDSLRRARLAQLLTVDGLAKKSGVSPRSINRYEGKEQSVRIDTLDCLAKALSVKVKDIARLRAGAAPANADRTTLVASARTALETLVDIERSAETDTPPPHVTSFGSVDTLTARRLQHVFTAFRLHEGERYVVRGRVDTMRGLAPDEAKLLGSKSGVAARFHVIMTVAPGHVLGVTVHTAKKEHTATLQARHGEEATMVARVVVAAEEDDDNVGFTSFITRIAARRPWALVVDEVLEGAPRKKGRAKG
jgi:transcriptional regulator with XRE-family HTH domain